MDTDRPPHRCTSSGGSGGGSSSTTSELFICFTSRLSSSSSMKISSKSILSPGRARDSSQISLSTSLSRRLRNSGSIKGGQASPMFPATNGKKRGCNSFENPEPSSPKVTCIGQVRVKTKKQGKKMRARSKSSRREVSFRKTEQTSDANANANGNHFHQFQQQECLPHHRNQRWVHLPVTICEALRAFGAEFNCFLPCRSSCMASDNNNKEERASNAGGGGGESGGTSTSCGAVFARWLLAEKIELVVGDAEERDKEDDDDDEDDDMMPRRSQRRHVFDDIVIEEAESKNEILEVDDEKEEESRVSICVPPKNALLLMRCRSDPVKMAALANRFWECPPPPDEADEDNQENDNENGGSVKEESHLGQETEQLQTEDVFCEKLDSFSQIVEEEHQIPEAEVEAEADVLLDSEEKEEESDNQQVQVQVQGDSQKQDQEDEEEEEEDDEEEEEVLNQSMLEEETVQSASSTETFADLEDQDNVTKSLSENEHVLENEPELAPEQVNEEAFDEESGEDEQELEAIVAEQSIETTEKILHEEKEEQQQEEETVTTTTTTHERSEPEESETIPEPETGQQSKERQSQNLLPDCLLMMMCEPKLSMEVSKETWVCSTDFIRWHPSEKKPPAPPQQIVNKTDGCDEPKKRVSIDLPPAPKHQIMQPPRSSCSFPAAPPFVRAHGAQSMNTMVEQKLVGAKHSYEPFSLTRCKSEPLRSSAKLAPEACFWKNRKLEPHRPAATLGVGAAGVGC
ncbi:hypothetical protein EZV62_008110 [Acer yangbiense]|uniref:Uncharacterized protein n=1 Tax=Acer yangbiense TaxID=1000413 RepID=A0A5C7ICT6_9ROSI|nr:hypothetical protein EZV62_008110 [Acer yangbiense]